MNVIAMTSNPTAVKQFAAPPRPWWNDRTLVALVRRGPFRDCNDVEFDQAVAFCKARNLSPLTGQLFAWVFNKADEKKRNMVLVTSLMGYRAIANRSGDYMPGLAKAYFDDALKDEMTNPRGILRAEATVKRFIHGGWQELVEEAFWESFAPIVKTGEDDDAYEWIDTGEKWEDTGKPKKRKKLRSGATIIQRLDPKKDGWIRMPDVMLKKIPEAQGLRRGWPEDLSGLYIEEEMHRSQVIDADYTDVTPSQMAEQAASDQRLARIGGTDQIGATFDASNDIVYVPVGQFADKALEATAKMKPDEVAAWVERNKEALRYFWGKSATDALALKKVLETRAAGAAGERQQQPSKPADKAAPAIVTARPEASAGAASLLSKAALSTKLKEVKTKAEHLAWAQTYKADVNALDPKDRDDLMDAFHGMRDELK